MLGLTKMDIQLSLKTQLTQTFDNKVSCSLGNIEKITTNRVAMLLEGLANLHPAKYFYTMILLLKSLGL